MSDHEPSLPQPAAIRTRAQLLDGAAVVRRAAEACSPSVAVAATEIAQAFRQGGKLLLCGNGGSAADCQHMAAELMSRLSREFDRPALPAIALTTDTSFLTGFTNDNGYEAVFERQVEALGKPGDVLIGISTSGSSRNVIRAVESARARGLRVIALTGETGTLADLSDVAIRVPSRNTQHVQQAHLAIEHVLCDLVEDALFAPRRERADMPTRATFEQSLADEHTQVRLCVAVLLRDAQGRILLEKRRDCGLWGLPGGRVEPGESLRQAAARELLEETGFRVSVTRLLGVYSGPVDRIVTFPDRVVQIVDVLLEAEIDSGDLTLSDESEAMAFFAPTAVPPEAELIPPARQVLRDVASGAIGVIA